MQGKILDTEYVPLDYWVEVYKSTSIYYELVDLKNDGQLACYAAIPIQMSNEFATFIIKTILNSVFYLRVTNHRITIGVSTPIDVRKRCQHIARALIKFHKYEQVHTQLLKSINALAEAIAMEHIDDKTID